MMTLTRTAEARPVQLDTPRPGTNRRRWFVGSLAGLGIAGLLAGLGTVMTGNANFSDSYVTDQLVKQRITFKAFDALTDQERKSDCVVRNAGKPLTTGKQAECFANEYLGLHIQNIGKGRTYAELEGVRSGLAAQIAAAQASGDPELPKLQKDLAELTGQREAIFKAETLRGILLTSFGFGTLGEKVGEAGTVAYGAAGGITLLSLAGLAVGSRTPRYRNDWSVRGVRALDRTTSVGANGSSR
jgi:hypothetical protein